MKASAPRTLQAPGMAECPMCLRDSMTQTASLRGLWPVWAVEVQALVQRIPAKSPGWAASGTSDVCGEHGPTRAW